MGHTTLHPALGHAHGRFRGQTRHGKRTMTPAKDTWAWASSEAHMLRIAPGKQDLIPLEERTLPVAGTDDDYWVKDFETAEATQWRRFRHGLLREVRRRRGP